MYVKAPTCSSVKVGGASARRKCVTNGKTARIGLMNLSTSVVSLVLFHQTPSNQTSQPRGVLEDYKHNHITVWKMWSVYAVEQPWKVCGLKEWEFELLKEGKCLWVVGLISLCVSVRLYRHRWVFDQQRWLLSHLQWFEDWLQLLLQPWIQT